jgi:hypothetical protein
MSDALLSDDIKLWLSEHARSHMNAKPRRLLLAHLCSQGHWPSASDTADRAMRKACEQMPMVGSCCRGYFLIVTAEDRRIAQGQLAAPAASMFERKRQIEDAAPQGQIPLFDEGRS